MKAVVAQIASQGRGRTFADLHRAAGRLCGRDRDRYIIANPTLVGQPAAAITGLETGSSLEKAWSTAFAGGGWMQCDMLSPGMRRVAPKACFILPLGQSECTGCDANRALLGAPQHA